MRKGEQKKILHKGSKKKDNAFITLLYPLNGIKFNTSKQSKTRNSSNDFINYLKSIKICQKKKCRQIHHCNRQCASFHVSKKTKQFIERQSDDC
jgi:hypothetical protein